MQQSTIQTERFTEAVETGEVINRGSYHQPQRSGYWPHCGCKNTTSKGAYRDVSVKMPDGRTIHYYHQSPVVVEKDGKYRLDSCGWDTSTTKERINRYIPRGYRVFQRDFEWFVKTPEDEKTDFEDGMVIG